MQPKNDTLKLLFLVGLIFFAILFCSRIMTGIGNTPRSKSPFTEFQAIQSETPLAGTHYQIEYANQNITLRNTFTPATFPVIKRYSPVAAPPAYQLLGHAKRLYLIIRLGSGGNSGAYWFKVYDLEGMTARDLTAASADPDMGLSCNAPVLEQDSLKFVISTDCSFKSAYSIRVYWLPLTAAF